MITKFKKVDNKRRLVLVVDDEKINRELLGFILKNDYEVLYAENGKQALEIITEKRQMLSLVLLDLLMPEMNGFELLEKLKKDVRLKNIPVIVLTSEKPAEVKSLELGAADFITKPYDVPKVILARVRRIVELSEDKMMIKDTEGDSLTGLYNKQFFFKYVQHIDKYYKEKKMDSLVLNIDHFHLLNELYGRPFGDRVLKLIAENIKSYLVEVYGIGCRVEADTFYIYCEHQEEYDTFMERLMNGVAKVIKSPKIRIRMGVYNRENQKLGNERKFDQAKLACDRIGENFSTSIAFYDMEIHKSMIYSERLINDIHDAIEQNQFIVYYQPVYRITGGKPELNSAEALVRWKHPQLGMLGPDRFIPLFENNGLIQMIDYYVWEKAAIQVRKWKDQFGVLLPVSVNVSRIDIQDSGLKDKLLSILKENGLTTKSLYLELTESAYGDNVEKHIQVVQELRDCGFKVEMDDFGSGYSSLNMLSRLPIDVLKLDMEFVSKIHKDAKSYRLVEIIMDIAGYLEVPVIAEGVEIPEQLKLVKKVGCEYVQGYHFSKPVPPNEFERFLKRRSV